MVFVQITLCEIRGAVWACVELFLRLGKLSHKSNVGGSVAACCLCGQAFSGSAISESRISVKVLGKKTSRCGELFTHQSQSNQPCSHCEFRIFCLLWLWACCFQFLCHFRKCKAKLNVAFQLSCVKNVFLFCCRLVKLEKSKFDCAFVKVAWKFSI